MDYRIGQRWICHADNSLGLGLVQAVDARRVTLHFPAVDEDRTYAIANAPLSRLRYRPGDTLRSFDAIEITVTAVSEMDGVLIYVGADATQQQHRITEIALDSRVELTSPLQRLLTAQLDSIRDFELRYLTFTYRDRWQRSAARGLLGSRTSLLPHQLYIAHRVAQHSHPRVLLADEVGLGKTIEAGLIIHRQLLTGRANRVLILVPEPLLHQWLVEMLRRFNLAFSLFDRDRLDALDSPAEAFDSEQLVLCSLELLGSDPALQAAVVQADWDIAVIDEAHHLFEDDGTVATYTFVQELVRAVPGLLLLTATPERLGKAGYFSQLQLLDPARYHDLDAFVAEEAEYIALADLVDAVERGERPPALASMRGIDASVDTPALIEQLLDRHGTGRVMYRNTRRAISGFPARKLHRHHLDGDPGAPTSLRHALYPELRDTDERWLEQDPRVAWLVRHLKQLRPDKALIICAHARTATQLEHYLHLRSGIRSAAFHEGLTIIERDRAAAYFADSVQGAQTLVCSEIGSEGRNFQFARHLILFDLPLHPDLLEQRIGRLDRIGRSDTIEIHVPYVEGSAQHRLLDWYDMGLGQFSHSFAAGAAVLHDFRERLHRQLLQPDAEWPSVLAETGRAARDAEATLQAGRDRLLERNSLRPADGDALRQRVLAEEHSEELASYLLKIADAYGIEHEPQSDHTVILHPTEHQRIDQFPLLPDEGVTLTADRELALAREELLFLSWDHPMIQQSMELICLGDLGNAAVATLQLKGIAPGTILLECLFTLDCPAPRELGVDQYLALAPLRLLLDQSGRNLATAIPQAQLSARLEALRQSTAATIVNQARSEIERLLAVAREIAAAALAQRVTSASATAHSALTTELDRLQHLATVNPAVRHSEIQVLEHRLHAVPAHIARAQPQLQGLRLIIAR